MADEGLATVARIRDAQHPWANGVAAQVGEADLRQTLDTVRRLIKTTS